MNRLQKFLVGSLTLFSLLSLTDKTEARFSGRTIEPSYGRNMPEDYKKMMWGLAITAGIIGGILYYKSDQKKGKSSSSDYSDDLDNLSGHKLHEKYLFEDKMESIVRRRPSVLDSSLNYVPNYFGTGLGHESPETAIARTKPDLASDVLKKQILASAHEHGMSELTKLAASALYSNPNIRTVSSKSVEKRRNFLGIVTETYEFEGTINID